MGGNVTKETDIEAASSSTYQLCGAKRSILEQRVSVESVREGGRGVQHLHNFNSKTFNSLVGSEGRLYSSGGNSSSMMDQESMDQSEAEGGDLETSFSANSSAKSRRRRTAFTSEQLLELEREFHAKKYLSLTERSQIATNLKLTEVQVRRRSHRKNWVISVQVSFQCILVSLAPFR